MPAPRYVEGNGLDAMLAAKKSAGVPPEMNIREFVTYTPQSSANKAAHSGFETQRRCHQKSKTGVIRKKTLFPPKNSLKNQFL